MLLAASGAAIAACDVDPREMPTDAGADVPFIDAGGRETVVDAAARADASSVEVAPDAPDLADASDAAFVDTLPPERVDDLAAVAETHAAVRLTWTAPTDAADAGAVAAYELRYATTPIVTLADFAAATPTPSPSAMPPGAAQSIVVSGLAAATEYHFALRARDAAGNFGSPSNDAIVTTKARATFLIAEIAPLDTANEGGDFVELVAVSSGSAAGIEVRHATSASPSALLYRLAPLDVVSGDRIVVHTTGLPAAAGFAQEDLSKNRAESTEPSASSGAFDVYSAVDNLLSTSSVISVLDGAAYQDVVAYSDRASANASTTVMTAFANAHAAGAWAFAAPPVDGNDDCPVLLDAVNANAALSSPVCGGSPGFLAPGYSLQRNGVVDTNTRQDFFVAPQTRGATNAPYCAPESAALALTEVNPSANLLELTVTQGGLLRGFTVRRDPRASSPSGTLLGTLPSICGAVGDVIVFHLNAPDGSVSEVVSKAELPAAAHPGNYDGAWDVVQTSSSSALPYATSLVVAVRSPTGAYVEGAAFSSQTLTPTDGGTYQQALAYLQTLGLWLPADCGGASCTNASSPSARDLAASWSGVGASSTEASCGRVNPTSSRTAQSWGVGPSTFGQ